MNKKETSQSSAFDTVVFDNSYTSLPESFYTLIKPMPVKSPTLLKINIPLANKLGLDERLLKDEATLNILAGNETPPNSSPLSQVYAGHQFAHFVPQLGDGRAHLIGEIIDKEGVRFDLQLKGSGPTPYSRRADGRAALGPVMREYIVSEAMHALGIPTTRALSVVSSGQKVVREELLPGGVLARVAKSHIRVGTFEYFAARGEYEGLKVLADYVIQRHYPKVLETKNPYLSLLECVTQKQAGLIARWMGVGFIHGVMNTDNTSIACETIDYGPCAFMDNYYEKQVFSAIDRQGRYAYCMQPAIIQWNMARFAEALLPLIDETPNKAVDKANEVIKGFDTAYESHWLSVMRQKLGLLFPEKEDKHLVTTLLTLMEREELDFTLTFSALTEDAKNESSSGFPTLAKSEDTVAWYQSWRERIASDDRKQSYQMMKNSNPLYIPRNHQIEKAIQAAYQHEDYTHMYTLCEVLSLPFTERSGFEDFKRPPKESERVYQTFCGT